MARQTARDSCQAPKSPPKLSFISRSLKFKQGKDQKWPNPSLPWPCACLQSQHVACYVTTLTLYLVGNPETRAQGQSDGPSYGEGRARGCLVSVRRCGAPSPGGFPDLPPVVGMGGKSQGHQWMSPGLSRCVALPPPWPQTLLTCRVTSLTCQFSACSWRDCGIGETTRARLECKPCLCLGDFQQAAFP